MEQYEYPMWANEYEKGADITNRIASQIRTGAKRINSFTLEEAKAFFSNIVNAINYWTGSTYVGTKKKPILEKTYRSFFKALTEFVLALQGTDKPLFHECADLILYRGTVYRYLGHNYDDVNKSKIEPVYNDIYVSWSKEPRNSYVESKLSGTMTWMSAEIRDPNYGIDLEGLEEAIYRLVGIECRLTKGDEHEVVFPTVQDCITEIKYIEPEFEEDKENDED